MIREHEVQIPLAGNPRWWTVTNPNGSREIVRVVLEKGRHYSLNGADPDAPDEAVVFVLLPKGEYKWPPLVVAALRMGKEGWDSIKEKGGRIVIYPEALARKLELMLVAS